MTTTLRLASLQVFRDPQGVRSSPAACTSRAEPKVRFSGLYYKCFTIVIYVGNDSGQYYKTTITIIIDNPR
jgi:hypothetical protein